MKYVPVILGFVSGIFITSMLNQFYFSVDTETKKTQSDSGYNIVTDDTPLSSSSSDKAAHKVDPKLDELTKNLVKAFKKYAQDGVIVISSLDYGYFDMGLNMYYTSLRKFDIKNYVFVASHPKVCPEFDKMAINCVTFRSVKDSDKASRFYTVSFMLKSYLKTIIVTAALKQGLTVLLVDVDMVFMKNPFENFPCPECDIQMMSEWKNEGVVNTGFYLAKPTRPTIELHEKAMAVMDNLTKMDTIRGSDQKHINDILKIMVKKKQIKLLILDDQIFTNALNFFDYGRRYFRGQNVSKEVVVIHNNFVISAAAKIYRFKEYGLWDIDDNGYYSDPNAKYLMFDNPIDITPQTDPGSVIIREKNALKTALAMGKILNRTVILPTFHNFHMKCENLNVGCRKQWETCSLQGLYFIESFHAQFGPTYREHSFLDHPLVPPSVKESLSPVYLFESSYTKQELKKIPQNVTILSLRNITNGIAKDEIENLFKDHTEKYSVVRFHSLYVNFTEVQFLAMKFLRGFTRSDYDQHYVGGGFFKRYNVTV